MDFYTPAHRLVMITGHYGSGKTNLAVNLALHLRAEGKEVSIVDMDIVNPYFRTADSKILLENAGVRCIIPEFANTNVDIPALPAEIYSAFSDDGHYTVFDVGGEDIGAAALGMFSAYFEKHGYDMLYICSMYRPLTAKASDTALLCSDIEKKSRLHCTGIVNNSNIGPETTAEDFIASIPYAEEVARLCGLPVVFHAAMRELVPDMKNLFVMRNFTKELY